MEAAVPVPPASLPAVPIPVAAAIADLTDREVRHALDEGPLAAASDDPTPQARRVLAFLRAKPAGRSSGAVLVTRMGLLCLVVERHLRHAFEPPVRKRLYEWLLQSDAHAGQEAFTLEAPLYRLSFDVDKARTELRERVGQLKRAKRVVESRPGVMGGVPCIRGTRLPVHWIPGMLDDGDMPEAIADAHGVDAATVRLAALYAKAYPLRGRPPKAAETPVERPAVLEDLGPPARVYRGGDAKPRGR